MIDLAKQARDHVLRLDGPGGPAKVTDTNFHATLPPYCPPRKTCCLYPNNGALTDAVFPPRPKNWPES